MHDKFSNQLRWAEERGLFLNQRIQRKCVDGICGMYAKSAINKGSLLASFPVDQLLSSKSRQLEKKCDESSLNWICNAVVEKNKPDTEYEGIFAFFEPLSELRKYHCYFLNEKESSLIQEMNPQLYNWILQANRLADQITDAVQRLLPSHSRDSILETYLNYRSRGFHPFGIVPVLDQFNHSDLLGQQDKFEDGRLCVYAKVDYQKDDQIFISYGPKDLYHHAINYSYFDKNGPHFVEFGRKAIQCAEGELGAKTVAHLKQFFKIEETVINGVKAFYFDEPLMLLIENRPSQDLVNALKEICRVAIGRPASDQELTMHAAKYFQVMIEDQLKLNHVEQVNEDELTPRTRRFYDLLKKEKSVLLNNRAALETYLKAS